MFELVAAGDGDLHKQCGRPFAQMRGRRNGHCRKDADLRMHPMGP